MRALRDRKSNRIGLPMSKEAAVLRKMRAAGGKVAVSNVAEAFVGGACFAAGRIIDSRPHLFSRWKRDVPRGEAGKAEEIRGSGSAFERSSANRARVGQSRAASGNGCAKDWGHANGCEGTAGPRRGAL